MPGPAPAPEQITAAAGRGLPPRRRACPAASTRARPASPPPPPPRRTRPRQPGGRKSGRGAAPRGRGIPPSSSLPPRCATSPRRFRPLAQSGRSSKPNAVATIFDERWQPTKSAPMRAIASFAQAPEARTATGLADAARAAARRRSRRPPPRARPLRSPPPPSVVPCRGPVRTAACRELSLSPPRPPALGRTSSSRSHSRCRNPAPPRDPRRAAQSESRSAAARRRRPPRRVPGARDPRARARSPPPETRTFGSSEAHPPPARQTDGQSQAHPRRVRRRRLRGAQLSRTRAPRVALPLPVRLTPAGPADRGRLSRSPLVSPPPLAAPPPAPRSPASISRPRCSDALHDRPVVVRARGRRSAGGPAVPASPLPPPLRPTEAGSRRQATGPPRPWARGGRGRFADRASLSNPLGCADGSRSRPFGACAGVARPRPRPFGRAFRGRTVRKRRTKTRERSEFPSQGAPRDGTEGGRGREESERDDGRERRKSPATEKTRLRARALATAPDGAASLCRQFYRNTRAHAHLGQLARRAGPRARSACCGRTRRRSLPELGAPPLRIASYLTVRRPPAGQTRLSRVAAAAQLLPAPFLPPLRRDPEARPLSTSLGSET